MSRLESISCRLCINICNGHRGLYDEDGRRNMTYALTEKYFSSVLLNMECVDRVAVICMECWRQILEFHTFQKSVLLAQKMSLLKKRTEVVVKSEIESQQEEEEFITIRDLTNATTSAFSKAQRADDACNADDADPQSEAIAKSEVEFIEYTHTRDYVCKNNASTFSQDRDSDSCDEESEEPDTTDERWEELDVKQENESTDSESERSVGSFSSDDEMPLACQTGRGTTEPNNPTEQGSVKATSPSTFGGYANIYSSQGTKNRRKINSLEKNLKQEFNSSDGTDGNSSSGGEISSDEAQRDNLVGAAEPERNPKTKAKRKYKRIRMTYKTNLKTVQEYDDLIAQWRPTLECVICTESYASFSLLQQHFQKQHPPEKCHILCCQRKFYHRYEIEKHIQFHIQPNGFKCERCYECFTTNSNLQAHLQRMHSGNRKSEKVELMKDVSDTDNSRKSKQATKERTCEECGKLYKSLSSLQRHKKYIHVAPCEIGTNKCTICAKVYKTPRRLREHMVIHAAKSVFSCIFCPNTFTYRGALYDHLKKMHPNEWQEKKEAQTKDNKAKGRKVHKCDICDKVYQRSNHLREHQAKHEGRALHTCTYCSKTFIYIATFRAHLKREHPEEQQQQKQKKAKD